MSETVMVFYFNGVDFLRENRKFEISRSSVIFMVHKNWYRRKKFIGKLQPSLLAVGVNISTWKMIFIKPDLTLFLRSARVS